MKKKLISLIAALAISVSAGVHTTAHASNTGLSAGLVSTVSSSLNVRDRASTSSSIVASLPKGSLVTLISQSGSWWKVLYETGKYGYVSGAYMKPVSGSYGAFVNTISGNLNVRFAPYSSAFIQTSIPKGTSVVVLSESGSWSKILYNGTETGYVSSRYLSANTAPEAGTGYGQISLSVVDYKQTDPQWSGVLLGNSQKTLGSIGCTTTALAMTESHRLNTAISPAEMAKRLRYMPDGSLYWPDNYLNVTDGQNYLGTIYSLLKQGKPVILGAKNSSGRQHWVVVTGFTGGNTLNPSQFTINDPGSRYRHTLQEFLNLYPTFYKIVYAR